jgi:hypothetical protein
MSEQGVGDNNAGTTRRRGPGRPFVPGNPGRRVGSRNKRTLLVEALMAADIEAITESVIKAAKQGDVQAARVVLDRICPARRGSVVTFKASRGGDAAALSENFQSVVAAMADGQLSPEEGVSIANVLTQQLRVVETAQLEERLSAVEAQLSIAQVPRRVA